jgi:hypothetical protein
MVARPTDEQVRALADYVLWSMREGAFNGCDIDGAESQDKALALGIVYPVEMHEPCREACACTVWDDFPLTCYRFRDWLLEAAGQHTLEDASRE